MPAATRLETGRQPSGKPGVAGWPSAQIAARPGDQPGQARVAFLGEGRGVDESRGSVFCTKLRHSRSPARAERWFAADRSSPALSADCAGLPFCN
jgi:hypothetical protein